MPNLHPILGCEIRSFRNSHGLTQADLAKHLGVSTRTVEEWERFQSTRAPPYLRLALAAFSGDIDPFYGPLQITEDGDGFRVRIIMGDPAFAGDPLSHVYPTRVEAEIAAEVMATPRGPKRRDANSL